ncbi:MAG: hypothetical protein K9M49_06910 [Candidatus Marinimicrobia bacterium]|nr:hypothetical protein [Candidatus Neomarinimicrobiota bacterium]MCF7904869.1 hypothetical protein [Candidatus Neomarinimicrobiota bacterium]
MDEPTSSLDPKLAQAVLKLVEKLRASLNLTVIAVSHDYKLMKKIATRALLLSRGELIREGTIQSLEQTHAFEQAGLLTEGEDDEA